MQWVSRTFNVSKDLPCEIGVKQSPHAATQHDGDKFTNLHVGLRSLFKRLTLR